jgi:RNA polymerase sigma-70 factor, ECF subfamily
MDAMEPTDVIDDVFTQWVQPYQAELLVHCYRILGSLLDAEDALQEAMLNAWRRQDSLRDRAALRAWLYRIATNVSLDLLERRKRRSLPYFSTKPSDPEESLPEPVLEPVWLEPLPDEVLVAQVPGPEARYDQNESIRLAFLALLQQLPGRQRAVLILRDVLGWKAEEVANLLETSTAAVNSALQRARATLDQRKPDWMESLSIAAADSWTADLLARYQQAWENEDAADLVSLLREDAILSMPPVPAWFLGRDQIERFYRLHLFGSQPSGRYRLLAARANGCPAFAVYQLNGQGSYTPVTLQVLTFHGGKITEIYSFLNDNPEFYRKFGLPSCL